MLIISERNKQPTVGGSTEEEWACEVQVEGWSLRGEEEQMLDLEMLPQDFFFLMK